MNGIEGEDENADEDEVRGPVHARSGRRLSMNHAATGKRRNLFRVVIVERLQPRVASQARQPWALRRNPFGILSLKRFMVPVHARSEKSRYQFDTIAASRFACRRTP